MSAKYQLDLIFRRALLFSKMYTQSWGNPEVLKRVNYYRENYMSKGTVMELVERVTPKMVVTKRWQKNNILYMEGYFKSPLATYASSLFPADNVGIATWKGLFPVRENVRTGLVLHLAGTGDHSYFRREWGFANDLLKDGISSILIENPFYGTRKPKDQFRSSLLNVSDLFVMGAALMAECCFLLKWAKDHGHVNLGLSGVSMGGHMASLTASNMSTPTVLVPILSWTSAAPVFTFGALAGAINWEVLTKELRVGYISELEKVLPNNKWAAKLNDRSFTPTIHDPARRFMWILMEEFTNLSRYPMPNDPTLVRSIIAENDAYVLRTDMIPELTEIWPGAQVKIIPRKGHVETYLTGHSVFRNTIRNAFTTCAKRMTHQNSSSSSAIIDSTTFEAEKICNNAKLSR